MTIHVRPMTPGELDEFVSQCKVEYTAERVRAGESQFEADELSRKQFAVLFPGDRPAPGQLAFRVLDDERAVGYLWIGERSKENPEGYWVFDVKVDEAERGKGYGRAAMLLAEDEARAAGAKTLGLNVFGHNTVARRLYESMDYELTSLQMQKDL